MGTKAFVSGAIEQIDDRVPKAREITERSNYLLALHRTSLIERYIKAECYLAIRRRGVGGRQYGFLLKAIPVSGKLERPYGETFDYHASGEYEYVQEPAVLPDQIQIMEGKKTVIPSLVWPETFDDRLIVSRKPAYLFLSPASPSVTEHPLAFADREVNIFMPRVSVALGQGIRKKVQSAPNAVDHGPDFGIDHGRNGFNAGQAVEFFAGHRIGIDAHGVWPIISEASDASFQDWELGYGPIDRRLRIEEIGPHGKSLKIGPDKGP